MAKKKVAKKKAPKRNLPFNCRKKKNMLAIRLDHALDQCGLTVNELAFASGCSHITLYNILNERGVMLNNGNTLMGIAIALNVELDWLLDNKPARTAGVGRPVKTGMPSISKRPGAKHMKVKV